MVFQPIAVQRVAKSDKPDIFVIVAGPEKGSRLGYQPPHTTDRAIVQLKVRRRSRSNSYARAAGSLCQANRPKELPGEEWRVDQRVKRSQGQRDHATLFVLRAKRTVELPANGAFHVRFNADRIRCCVSRVKNKMIERKNQQVRRHIWGPAVAIRIRLGG